VLTAPERGTKRYCERFVEWKLLDILNLCMLFVCMFMIYMLFVVVFFGVVQFLVHGF